jgi:hypothetical protein
MAPSDEIPAEPAIQNFNCCALAFSHGLGHKSPFHGFHFANDRVISEAS